MLKKDSISVSFVGVLARVLVKIPNFNQEFCKNLFGNPAETVSFYGPEGFVVAVNNKPFPMVLIGPSKIIIKASEKQQLAEIVSKVKSELEIHNFSKELVAYGINWEYQYFDLGSDSGSWIWNRFVGSGINPDCRHKMCSRINLNLAIDDKNVVNVSVEPRVGVRDGLFIDVNHHHNILCSEFLGKEELLLAVDDSKQIVDKSLTELLER